MKNEAIKFKNMLVFLYKYSEEMNTVNNIMKLEFLKLFRSFNP